MMYLWQSLNKWAKIVEVFLSERDEDGAEILFPHVKRWLAYNEFGREVVRSRNERIKRLADDLPKVTEEYRKFRFDKL